MTTTSKIVLGVCGALAAGVAIGLLIAPEKGSEMRTKIKDTAGSWADHVGNLFSKAKNGAEDLASKAKNVSSAM